MNVLERTKGLNQLFVAFFLIVIGASNFYSLNIGESDRTLPFNAVAISISLLVITWGIGLVRKNERIRIPRFSVYTLGIVAALVSPMVFMKSDMVAFLPRLLMLLGVLSLYLALYQFKSPSPKHLLGVLAVAGLMQIVWGGYQMVITGQERPYGIFQQVNVYGSFMATMVAVSGFLALRKLSLLKNCFLAILSGSSVYLVYSTGSRTALISVVLVCLLLVPALLRNFSKQGVKLWLIATVAGWAVSLWPTVHSQIFEAAEPTQSLEEQVGANRSVFAKSGREYIYPQVMKLSLENVWTGVGFERFTYEYIHRTAHWYAEGEYDKVGLHNLDIPHSELLYWFAEGGLVSLMAFLVLIGLVLYRLFRAPLGWRLPLLAVIAPIALHTLLEYPLYHSQIHLVALILILFVINKYSRDSVSTYHIAFNKFACISVQSILVAFAVIYFATIMYATNLIVDFARAKVKDPAKIEFLHDNWLLGPRYERFYQGKFITDAINKRSESKVKEYILWADEQIEKRPSISEYRFLIFAYKSIGDDAKAESTKEEANHLYPAFEFHKRIFRVPSVIKGT